MARQTAARDYLAQVVLQLVAEQEEQEEELVLPNLPPKRDMSLPVLLEPHIGQIISNFSLIDL
ncbi:MAG: hypothetical protein QMD32_05470 [Smithellaceae bacterium]|nr:hypothetical protein [Smithellaceae bacterium]